MINDFSVKFNELELTKHFDVTEEPDRGLFPEIEHELIKVGRVNGSRSVSKRLSHRIIIIELFALSGDFRKTKDELADILFSGKQKLWFSDEPDRYWLAELTGESYLSKEIDHRGEAYGQLQFLVEDGISHSIEPKTFKMNSNNVINVSNKGTYKIPLSIYAKFLSDAPSIGFVSENNIVQFGDTEVYEEEPLPLSELITNDDMTPTSKLLWRHNVAQPRRNREAGDTQSKVEGTMNWMTDFVRASTFGPNLPNGAKPYWHGPSESLQLGQHLEGYGAKLWFAFYSTGSGKSKLNQKGLMEFNFYDADNNATMGFEICDNDINSNRIFVKFFVGDYEIFRKDLPKKYWAGGFNGSLEMRKTGAKFYFRLAVIKTVNKRVVEDYVLQKTYTNETIAGLRANRLDFWAAKGANSAAVTMQLALTRIWKYNTVDDSIIPLTFLKGDELYVDGSTNYAYLNGVRADNYRVIGSDQLFIIEPGNEEISVITEAELETVELMSRERFL